MPQEPLIALLRRARNVLDHYLFEADGFGVRDDVAAICMAIDDALPDERRMQVKQVEVQRSAA